VMIRIIIERKAKSAKDTHHLLALLRLIRTEAMRQPGYVSGETLVSTENRAEIIVISTWQSLKEWKVWQASEKRVEIEKQFAEILSEEAKITSYRYLSYRGGA
ncbi:antibiotic biosynthesis monooxygenase family protein, partial [Chloroflexota bacterium]